MRLFSLLALALLALGPRAEPEPTVTSAAPDRALTARAFEIHHRSLSDAADLVGELLSPAGSLTLKPRLDTLLVEDRPDVIERVADLIESFDIPPRQVDVTLSLFLGSRESNDGDPERPAPAREYPREVRGIIDTLSDVTRWTSYEPLGSRSVRGVEGQEVTADVSSDYRVAFTVGDVDESRDKIKFERFSLLRVIREPGHAERLEEKYRAAIVVDTGRLTLLVAARAPDSERALFLALQAEPE